MSPERPILVNGAAMRAMCPLLTADVAMDIVAGAWPGGGLWAGCAGRGEEVE